MAKLFEVNNTEICLQIHMHTRSAEARERKLGIQFFASSHTVKFSQIWTLYHIRTLNLLT